MSTKNKPGQFDCYAKIGDDEPYFVLRAKDPDAPAVVEEWARRRARHQPNGGRAAKIPEAMNCASAMRSWRERHMSAKPCGCDPGAKHFCAEHAEANGAHDPA